MQKSPSPTPTTSTSLPQIKTTNLTSRYNNDTDPKSSPIQLNHENIDQNDRKLPKLSSNSNKSTTNPSYLSTQNSKPNINNTTNQKFSQNSDNKICQWYCCSCGQSYGSVLYKENDNNNQSSSTINEKNQTTQSNETQLPYNQLEEEIQRSSYNRDNLNRNYIFDNLKYYSNVVYKDHHQNQIINSPIKSNQSTNYFDFKPSSSSTPTSSSTDLKSPSRKREREEIKELTEDNLESSPKIRQKSISSDDPQIQTPILSPLNINLELQSTTSSKNLYEYKQKVILDIPTRFICHRCNHMMCPYCLKLRLKDI
ncbi:uncharacterized protein KGF55_005559 [Candida pseudojiufengensis]|uniref:uncharacterized protein n=1 Tax=Candida pseudojiufengensis TaxID=497109 RepID=UPI002225B47E|nr:uncharacterized protein KGF55_005559 [Candida pseudojiufengensis]KAI5959069.1 hypothetical protein KGF55_005559 [Candida pseudojiufengensis]